MKPQQFFLLAVAAIVSMAVAAIVHAGRQPLREIRQIQGPLVPGLANEAAEITRLQIKQGETTVTLERKGDAWSIKERDGYPARNELARGLVARLAAAELVEPKTRVAANHAVLELEDPSGKDAKSKLVRLIDGKGGLLADVVIGRRKPEAFGPSKSGTYVRQAKSVETWLATGDIDVSADVRGWAEGGIVNLPPDKITKVTIEMPGEAPLVIERDKPSTFKLAALPEGRKLKEGNLVAETARAAASLELDDVRRVTAAPGGEKPSLVIVTSEGGPSVKLSLRRDAGADWMTVVADGEGDAKKAADEIAARTSGWEYKIPAAKAAALLKKLADFLDTKS